MSLFIAKTLFSRKGLIFFKFSCITAAHALRPPFCGRGQSALGKFKYCRIRQENIQRPHRVHREKHPSERFRAELYFFAREYCQSRPNSWCISQVSRSLPGDFVRDRGPRSRAGDASHSVNPGSRFNPVFVRYKQRALFSFVCVSAFSQFRSRKWGFPLHLCLCSPQRRMFVVGKMSVAMKSDLNNFCVKISLLFFC